jgi:hypothetical protein
MVTPGVLHFSPIDERHHWHDGRLPFLFPSSMPPRLLLAYKATTEALPLHSPCSPSLLSHPVFGVHVVRRRRSMSADARAFRPSITTNKLLSSCSSFPLPQALKSLASASPMTAPTSPSRCRRILCSLLLCVGCLFVSSHCVARRP